MMSSNGTKSAHLVSPLQGYQLFLHEMKSKSAVIRKRATDLVIMVGAVGFDTLVKEACGVGCLQEDRSGMYVGGLVRDVYRRTDAGFIQEQ